jgi:hypothetical protein
MYHIVLLEFEEEEGDFDTQAEAVEWARTRLYTGDVPHAVVEEGGRCVYVIYRGREWWPEGRPQEIEP